MSIFNRVSRIVTATANELLDTNIKPESELKEKIAELEEHIREAKEAVAEFAVTHKKSEKELDKLKRLRDEWQHKAETSLKAGDEMLAKRALGERIKSEERIKRLEPMRVSSASTYNQLKTQVIELSDQLKGARMTLAELLSRDRAAKAQQKFGTKVDAASASGSVDFSRFEEQVMQKEAEVEIEREMRGELMDLEDRLDKQTAANQVDNELEALKKQMGADSA